MAAKIEKARELGDSARRELTVELTWRGGLRFEVTDRTGSHSVAADADAREAGVVDGAPAPAATDPQARPAAGAAWVDGDAAVAPSPMETLLVALGACGGSDVVDILRKGRQDVRGAVIRVLGERRSETPRRYVRIRAQVRLSGAVERAKAERAVRLAFESYCSVGASLDPALSLETEVVLEGPAAD